MSFTTNQARFLINILPIADGSLSRLDCEHLLGIFPDLSLVKECTGQSNIIFDAYSVIYADKNMNGQSDIVFAALATMYADRNMQAQTDIVFDASCIAYIDRNLAGQADIEITPYMFMGLEGDAGLIARY